MSFIFSSSLTATMNDSAPRREVRCLELNGRSTDCGGVANPGFIPQVPISNSVQNTQECNKRNKFVPVRWPVFWQSKFDLERRGPSIIEPSASNGEIELYRKRFWILFIFSVCSMLNAMQWIQYSVITEVVMCYYNISLFTLNWTTLIYFIMYIPCVFPVSWFLDRYGMRNSLLIGSFLTCISTIVQCFSQERNGFPIAMVSQTIAAVAQVFILPLPPKIASVWFGKNEVCRATAIGVFGNQLGVALGFLFSPLVVTNDCSNPGLIKHGRSIVAYTLAASDATVFLLLFLTFQSKPPLPPSLSEAAKTDEVLDYKKSIRVLFKNSNFILLTLGYGLISGVCFAFAAVLNPMISEEFKDSQKTIGWLGTGFIIAGTVGSVVAGYILDLTHKFKETSLAVYVLSLLTMAIFAGCLYAHQLWLISVLVIVLGFFLASYLPIGFEFATEITYPESEGITAGILNASLMFFGFFATFFGSSILENYGRLASVLSFCAVLLLGCGVTCFIKSELRRTESNYQTNHVQTENFAVSSTTGSYNSIKP